MIKLFQNFTKSILNINLQKSKTITLMKNNSNELKSRYNINMHNYMYKLNSWIYYFIFEKIFDNQSIKREKN